MRRRDFLAGLGMAARGQNPPDTPDPQEEFSEETRLRMEEQKLKKIIEEIIEFSKLLKDPRLISDIRYLIKKFDGEDAEVKFFEALRHFEILDDPFDAGTRVENKAKQWEEIFGPVRNADISYYQLVRQLVAAAESANSEIFVYRSAWNQKEILQRYGNRTEQLRLQGFGNRAEELKGYLLKTFGPSLLYGIRRIALDSTTEKSRTDPAFSYAGMSKIADETDGSKIIISGRFPGHVEGELVIQVAGCLHWDEVDFLTVQDRISWLSEVLARFDQPNHLKSVIYEDNIPKEMSGSQPGQVLPEQLKSYWQYILQWYFTNPEALEKKFPAEYKLAEKWMNKIKQLGKDLPFVIRVV